MTELLKIKDLTKNYKNFSLCNVSFGIEPGKITGLIGINGAGKTTVIKCIGQLEQPDSGELYFAGEKLGISPAINEKIGYVLDSSYFYENLSIRNMTKVIAASYTNWDWAVFQSYCDRFQLDVRMKIETLSKGMKMKYALALALSHHAELLVMDEPTGGLDPLVRKMMMKILKQFVENGKNSVLFSTHITSDLEKIADHILFLHRGKIVFDGALKELQTKYRTVCGQERYLTQVQDRLVSWEAQDGSFTGLAETEDCIGLPEQISVKDASIEEIMLGVISGKGDAEG